jgi:hypothetical protein
MFRASGMLHHPLNGRWRFLTKLESKSTRKRATCEVELTSTMFSKKCLEYTVWVNVTCKKKTYEYSTTLQTVTTKLMQLKAAQV